MDSNLENNTALQINDYLTNNNMDKYQNEEKRAVICEFSEKFSLNYLKVYPEGFHNIFMDNKSYTSVI